jgi:hypothetical protein
MRPLHAVLLAAALLPVLTLACGGGGSGPGGSNGGGNPPQTTCPTPTVIANPTFTAHILPAIQSSCGSAVTACHGGSALPSGHISYATGGSRTAQDVYNDLVNRIPSNAPAGYFRVKPNDVAKSWLIEKVTSDQPGGAGFGARMPASAPNLCTATVDTWKAWINAGAPL